MKKRICFLIGSHYSHTMGGVESQAKLVIDALNKTNKYDIFYICHNLDSGYIPIGYKVIMVGNIIGEYLPFTDTLSLYLALCTIRPDIIYQNGGSFYAGVAAFYARKFGARYIYHIASDKNVLLKPRKKFFCFLKDFLEKLMFDYGIRNANSILGQTHYQNLILWNRYNRRCNAFIPPGHPLIKGKIKKSKKLIVLWIGNFRFVKQPEVFVKLAHEFSDRSDIEFVMIGGIISSTEKYCAVLQDIDVTPNLRYLGQVSQEEVNFNLEKAHILVNTSLYEGFPNTFIQAWLHEVPIVSLNVDPDNVLIREKIGFFSQTFDKLVSDVAFLAENKQLREDIGERARKFAEKNYSSNIMIEKLSKHFM